MMINRYPPGPQEGDSQAALALWSARLIEAVNADNLDPRATAISSQTYLMLRTAPSPAVPDVEPALRDFERVGTRPLDQLRSDSVASGFTVAEGRPAALVARMTVPGGPWPGHYGLEAVVFDALPARFPGWFPPVSAPFALHFAAVREHSAGFSGGAGAVLFPEQLSVLQKPADSPFGLVFLDKLCTLFEEAAADVISAGTLAEPDGSGGRLHSLRELAFLAHEWGHVCIAPPPELMVARRRRVVAVLSEMHADLAAVDMLLDRADSPDARLAATVLVLDRALREAWLPRSGSQVDAIASRQLLTWLVDSQAITLSSSGKIGLDLDAVHDAVRGELATTRRIERACTYDDPSPAVDFLRAQGWAIDGKTFSMDIDGPIAEMLHERARSRRPGGTKDARAEAAGWDA